MPEVTADEKRELQVLETEYYEAADYEDSAVTDMYEEDVNPNEIMPCASNGTISWDVYAGVRRSTSSFHASSGQRIVLSVFSWWNHFIVSEQELYSLMVRKDILLPMAMIHTYLS